MIESRTFRVSGRVQGVGFRLFTWDVACREGLTGLVRNLPDGRVEAIAEGERDALDRFEWAISRGPAGARVDHVDRDVGPATGRYREFSIRG
jgi:acylphosphatase